MMTFAEKIRRQCRENSLSVAFCVGGAGADTITYGKLGYTLDNICSRLAQIGVAPGSIYGMMTPNGYVQVLCMLALERMGAVTITLENEFQAQALRLSGIISDRDVPKAGCPVYRITDDWLQTQAGPVPADIPERAPEDICRIAFTSGSTGRPKQIALTHGMLAKRIEDQNLAFGEDFKRMTRRFNMIGLNVHFGYRILIRTLAEGGLYCFPDLDLARNVRSLSLYGIQTVVGSPLQFSFLEEYGAKHPGSFPSVQLAICGGARLSPVFAERLRRNVCPRVMVGYGSSEAGIVAAGPAETLNLDKGEIGKVIPGVEVEIVDETSGKPVKTGNGLVRIRGTGVARGYYDDAAGQNSHFKDGWFYPGDIGSLSSGVLSIAGRKDHVVSFGGVKTTLETVEAQLMNAPAVKEIAVVPVSGDTEVKKVQAFVVPAEGWSEKAFWDYCHAKVENTFWPVKIAVLAALPRVASGKVDRQRLIASV